MNVRENGVFRSRPFPVRFDDSAASRERRRDPATPASTMGPSVGGLATSSTTTFKHVAISALDCALAHWYMVPGLKFQRSRVRLGLKSLFRRGGLPPSAVSLILHQNPDPGAYLGFHFASQFLARETLGNYLDVSSPWLFPFTLLANFRASSAMLLTAAAAQLRSLLSASNMSLPGGLHCEAQVSLADESYDTITSLCGPDGDVEHNTRDARNLWRVLKPGGTLLLSVPCIRNGADQFADRDTIYDVQMLERQLFDVLGQPKRYAIYGAQTPGIGDESAVGYDSRGAAGWGDSSIVGRDWRCYASLQDLPGRGVIVMKFLRPERESATSFTAFTPRLA